MITSLTVITQAFLLFCIMNEGIPTQKITGDRDATATYVTATRKDFKECLRKIFLEIAKRAFRNEKNITESVMGRALACWQDYFQAMKGGTNITEGDVKACVSQEAEWQRRFYAALRALAAQFRKSSFSLEILEPPSNINLGWDTGLTVGCDIRIISGWGHTDLTAFPLHPATAMKESGVIPAEVLFANKGCVVLLPYPLPAAAQPFQHESFWSVITSFPVKNVKNDFPDVKRAAIYNNFLLLDSEKVFSRKELEVLRKKYGVIAVVVINSENKEGLIFTGGEEVPLHIQLELLQ